jgi:phosphatidylserine/phosphatidylglycerophosphate/cardiolipin synthase-like enzyme
MTDGPLTRLDKFRDARRPLPHGYPTNMRTLFSPVDDVHAALAHLLDSAQASLVVCMYGFDDVELAKILQRKLRDEHCYVQLTLDKTQAAGAAERKILASMRYPASSIAVGTSEHGRIIHQKSVVIDGHITIGGSTNWSDAGERLQDNELHVVADPFIAAETRARIDLIHAHALTQQAAASA